MGTRIMRKAQMHAVLLHVAAMVAVQSSPPVEPVERPKYKKPTCAPTVHVNKHGKILGEAFKQHAPRSYAVLDGNGRKGKGERKRTAWRVK